MPILPTKTWLTERNKITTQYYKMAKEVTIEELAGKVSSLETSNGELAKAVEVLQKENSELKSKVSSGKSSSIKKAEKKKALEIPDTAVTVGKKTYKATLPVTIIAGTDTEFDGQTLTAAEILGNKKLVELLVEKKSSFLKEVF